MTREQLQQIRILIYAAYCEGDTEAEWMLVVIDAALAAPEQEPVATDCTRIMREQGKPYPRTCPRCGFGPCVYSSTIVIAAPAPAPQREWQSLTPDEINNCAGAEIYPSSWAMTFARAIEAALKEKNCG